MSPKSSSKEYKELMRQEDLLNKQDYKNRSEASIRKFYTELAQQTKRDPPNEKQYRKSILTSRLPDSTRKGGKRRKPRKTKKHRKKKSL